MQHFWDGVLHCYQKWHGRSVFPEVKRCLWHTVEWKGTLLSSMHSVISFTQTECRSISVYVHREQFARKDRHRICSYLWVMGFGVNFIFCLISGGLWTFLQGPSWWSALSHSFHLKCYFLLGLSDPDLRIVWVKWSTAKFRVALKTSNHYSIQYHIFKKFKMSGKNP